MEDFVFDLSFCIDHKLTAFKIRSSEGEQHKEREGEQHKEGEQHEEGEGEQHTKNEEERKRKSAGHHRASGFDPAWIKSHSWLLNTPDGMVCSLCRKHNPSGGNFVKKPSRNFRLDAVSSHQNSETWFSLTIQEKYCPVYQSIVYVFCIAVYACFNFRINCGEGPRSSSRH